MSIHKVKCPIDKLKELILKEYPHYYKMNKTDKLMIINFFTPEVDIMYEYLKESEKERIMYTYFYSYAAKDINNKQMMCNGTIDTKEKIKYIEDINMIQKKIEQMGDKHDVVILNITLLNEDKESEKE